MNISLKLLRDPLHELLVHRLRVEGPGGERVREPVGGW
jgi:hypothetical protein